MLLIVPMLGVKAVRRAVNPDEASVCPCVNDDAATDQMLPLTKSPKMYCPNRDVTGPR